MKRSFALALSVFLCSFSFSADVLTHTGQVTYIVAFPHSYGNYNENIQGLLGIYVEGLPKGCSDGISRVVISKDHPLHDSALSIAMMAKASGTDVKVAYFNDCTLRSESWDFAYIYITD